MTFPTASITPAVPVKENPMSSSRSARCIFAVAVALAVPLALVGCSTGSHAKASPTTAAAQAPSASGGGAGGRGGQGFPGVSGEIAAIQGSTLQVQGSGQQTAVTYTDSTAITQTVTGSLSDVSVGECVTGITEPAGQGSSASAKPGTAATTVTISKASSDGTCTGGFGGGGFGGSGGRGGFSGARPSGFPTPRAGSSRPTFRPGAGGRSGFTPPVSGVVTAVGSSTITVKETLPARGSSSSSASGSSSTKTITVGAKTKYQKNATATGSAVKVGLCVVAGGKAGSNGTVAATSLRLSPKTSQGCTGFGGAGFGRGGFGGAGGAGAGQGGGSGSND
ncbi:MAG TPA: hypothetical protein VFQ96_01530 [Microbacteriaceae bacterium]|nr:hypothetical protein [Microbacteriaceae bacterium]